MASFELLAVLMYGLPCRRGARCHGIVGYSGDRRGHRQPRQLLFERFMSTRYPLCGILMELALQLQKRDWVLGLEWLPREANRPSDDLANGNFKKFTPELRVEVDLRRLDFAALPAFLAEGRKFLAELRSARAARVDGDVRRERKRETLREREPW